MAKQVKQFRYYDNGTQKGKNYPETINMSNLAS